MKTRLKTAGILILALLFLVWLDWFWLNTLIFLALLFLATLEALKLFDIKDSDLAIVGLGLFAFGVLLCDSVAGYYKYSLFLLLALTSYLAFKNSENLEPIKPLLYPFIPILIMFGIYDEFGISYLVYLLVIVALMDSGAYFTGKFLGKHHFTSTSPNKTIEGVIGGILAVIFIGGAIYGLFMPEMQRPFLTALFVAISSMFGDLFESYLKRKAGVKDSGDIFPGHGGMLDRLDGYLFGGIAFSIMLAW